MEKLTQDLLSFRVCIQVRATESLKSSYATGGGQCLDASCQGHTIQLNPDVGRKHRNAEELKARGVNTPKANSAITVGSEHFALDAISQKEKMEKRWSIKQRS